MCQTVHHPLAPTVSTHSKHLDSKLGSTFHPHPAQLRSLECLLGLASHHVAGLEEGPQHTGAVARHEVTNVWGHALQALPAHTSQHSTAQRCCQRTKELVAEELGRKANADGWSACANVEGSGRSVRMQCGQRSCQPLRTLLDALLAPHSRFCDPCYQAAASDTIVTTQQLLGPTQWASCRRWW